MSAAFPARLQYDDRLNAKRRIANAGCVAILLAYGLPNLKQNAGGQESDNIELLPLSEIVGDDNRELRSEFHKNYVSVCQVRAAIGAPTLGAIVQLLHIGHRAGDQLAQHLLIDVSESP